MRRDTSTVPRVPWSGLSTATPVCAPRAFQPLADDPTLGQAGEGQPVPWARGFRCLSPPLTGPSSSYFLSPRLPCRHLPHRGAAGRSPSSLRQPGGHHRRLWGLLRLTHMLKSSGVLGGRAVVCPSGPLSRARQGHLPRRHCGKREAVGWGLPYREPAGSGAPRPGAVNTGFGGWMLTRSQPAVTGCLAWAGDRGAETLKGMLSPGVSFPTGWGTG